VKSFGEIKVARMRYFLPATTLVTLLGADLPGDLRAIHNLEMPSVNWLEFSGHFDRQFSARQSAIYITYV